MTTEYFAEGTVPEDVCVHHAAVRVCSVSGMLAGPYCPGGTHASSVRIIGGSPDSEDGPYLYTGNLHPCTVHTSASAAQPDPSEGNPAPEDGTQGEPNENPDANPEAQPGADSSGSNPSGADSSGSNDSGSNSTEGGQDTVIDMPPEDEPVANEFILDF